MTVRPVTVTFELDDEAQKALGDAIIATGRGGRPSYAEIAEFAMEAFEDKFRDEAGALGSLDMRYKKHK